MKLTEDDIEIQHEINSPYLKIKKWNTSHLGKEMLKHDLEAEQLKQQILENQEKARKWDFVKDKTGSKLFDGYIIGQKLQERIEDEGKLQSIINECQDTDGYISVKHLKEKLLEENKK